MLTATAERTALMVASVFYLLGYVTLFCPTKGNGRWQNRTLFLGLVATGLLVHTTAIALRWVRLEHGPFGNLYEILISNLWSLTFAVALFAGCFPQLLRTMRAALPVLLILLLWLFFVEPVDSFLPATYQTIWLYIHLVFGKLFLGCLLIAASLAGVAWCCQGRYVCLSLSEPSPAALGELSFRFAAVALLFDSAMLVSGAIWAQDAWGRYWAWDPLETWSFVTWLALVLLLHLRSLSGISQWLLSAFTVGVFVLAFLTFFGVPFISTAPHKGAI